VLLRLVAAINIMRRRAGVGAIQKKRLEASKYQEKSNELAENQLAEMSKQLEFFRTGLEEFARDHKHEIRRDPAFRKHFQDMCASIGVDPLASGKGFWSEKLGIGDFYYELAVQVVEVCMASAHRTGGLMELGDIRRRLIKGRGKSAHHQDISADDLLRAIKKLRVLGNGFTVIPLDSGRYLVQSVPGEFSMDQTAALQRAEVANGAVSAASLAQDLGWERERSRRALEGLLREGVVWLDAQSGEAEPLYWAPSIFSAST